MLPLGSQYHYHAQMTAVCLSGTDAAGVDSLEDRGMITLKQIRTHVPAEGE